MIPKKYNQRNLSRAIKEPSLILKELKRIVLNTSKIPHKTIGKKKFTRHYGRGTEVMSEDWDYLILLDACRYDSFIEFNTFGGTLESRISKGSHSEEFCRKNFENKQHFDTVYVTANGWGARICQDVFYNIIFTKNKEKSDSLHPTWDSLDPNTVINTALKAANKYPNKRMIIHLMQPHSPYFGTKASKIRESLAEDGILIGSSSKTDQNKKEYLSTLKIAARKGYISVDELQKIYNENLEYVLSNVEDLLSELEGRIVISSDHGELLGDRSGIWRFAHKKRTNNNNIAIGHPRELYLPELRKVPWFIIENGERPEIHTDQPENSSIENDLIEERLSALGYKD
ncbi:hypothetical protein [Natronocalculus amylovorans]|uniref:Uncharacterized protein n=1 Tax=Natronocalculus amylovorans TaxID=2917812 RepID=A0AAE3K8X0_9EURY|nr:hypothetical protein [Natronocalculus amylovorans]MCL9817483.1 hypothetical protein [Natronocalculus amylovorans]